MRKCIFNYHFSQARRTIENIFDIITTSNFRRAIIVNPEKVNITYTTHCLQNYLNISDTQNAGSNCPYCPLGYTDHEDDREKLIPGDQRLEVLMQSINQPCWKQHIHQYHIYDTLISNFVSQEGAVPGVPWQNNHGRGT